MSGKGLDVSVLFSRGVRMPVPVSFVGLKQTLKCGGLLWSVSVGGNVELTFHTHPDRGPKSATVRCLNE